MNNFEILYDSRLDYQSSKYPFRIIRYCLDSNYREVRFYKKQKEFYFDDIMIEKYIISLNKRSYKDISNIVIKFIGDEKIINYKLNNHIFELHYDKSDREFFLDVDEMKKYIIENII